MSPLVLRRFRAERLLRTEFEQLRVKVLATVQARLAARGVSIAGADLDASYAMAWHGLYSAQVSGEPIETPEAWLTLVTYRRALDEHRARARLGRLESLGQAAGGGESPGERGASGLDARDPDLAGALDDRAQLAALFEGIREALSAREREAAALCYLQGLTRAEAAERMGIGEKRMRKLMDGRGDGTPGVAAKIGTLAATIERGDWCEQRGSLMRALAFGILVPGGERHRLALAHHRHCPACRAYVASLRGIAALLPPWVLPPGLLGALTAHGAAVGTGATHLAGAAPGTGAGGAGNAAAGTAGAGGAGNAAAGAAGAGAAGAGGGWALAGGPLGAKLAVGCLLLVGTGCATLGVLPGASHGRGHGDRRHAGRATGRVAERVASTLAVSGAGRRTLAGAAADASSRDVPPGPEGVAIREFGIEGGSPASRSRASQATARAASAGAPAGSVSARQSAPVAATAAAQSSKAAAREFSPG